MSQLRRIPRSFFWIDQQMIRSGVWIKLSAEARLAYIALSASCDREGVSIWSRGKLMELSACKDPDEWGARLIELEGQRLIESLPEHSPPAIRLFGLEPGDSAITLPSAGASTRVTSPQAPVVVHTHTTIHFGGKAPHVESGTAS